MTFINTNSVTTERLDYRSIKQFKGEVIEDMSLWLEPFGIEIQTDKAVYQIYRTETGDRVAERITQKEAVL